MKPDQLAALHARTMHVPTAWTTQDFEDLLASPGTFLVTSETLSGFALGRVVLDEAELLTLAVAPDFQRRGIGQSCLTAFEETAALNGAGKAFLEVAGSNLRARALYSKNGWSETGLRPGYYRAKHRREDAILMQKTLTKV